MTNAQSRYIVSTLLLVVNYSRSIEDSVKAGCYNRTATDITDVNFPSTETGEREVETAMFQFGCTMSSKAIEAEMDKVGYRPATMKELLAYGEKNPNEQRKSSIIGLGSVAKPRNHRVVGSLVSDVGSLVSDVDWRLADLECCGFDWSGLSCFLGVRK